MTVTIAPQSDRLLKDLTDADLEDFKKLVSRETDRSQYPLADEVIDKIVIYSADKLLPKVRGTVEDKYSVMDDVQRALRTGPGVIVIKGMIPLETINRTGEVADEVNPRPAEYTNKASRRTMGFSEKHAKHDPESYAEYYGNEVLAAVCEAWLGPSYQLQGTLNATFKGGDQQPIHRDYHVSHQQVDRIRRIPVVNQVASQFLTLQSAIAHTDMPHSTGPTRFTPYSQLFEKGYIAVRDPKFLDFVRPNMISLELKKGDAVFFNPATFHQPGVNVTDDERVANLLQVSSPFGRSMESVDRLGMTKVLWPVIKRWQKEISAGTSKKTQGELDAVIAAACSDYGYPRIIDLDPKSGPETQAGIVREALAEGHEDQTVYDNLDKHQSWHQQ